MVIGDGQLGCFKSGPAGLLGLLRGSARAFWSALDCFGVGMNNFVIRLLCGSANADWDRQQDPVKGRNKSARDSFVVIYCCRDDGMLLQ